MRRGACWVGAVVLLAAVAAAARADDPKPKTDPPKEPPKSAAEKYQATVKEYEDADKKFMDDYQAAKTDEEREKAFKNRPAAAAFAKKFLAVAEEAPKDPVAVDALTWVMTRAGYTAEGLQALEMLARDHVTSDKIGPLCARLAHAQSSQVEPFLRDVLAKNPDHAVKGQACLALGQYEKRLAEQVRMMRENPDLVKQMEAMAKQMGAQAQFGPERIKALLAKDPDAMLKDAEKLFERVVKDFADVKPDGRPIEQTAKGELFELRHLSVGKTAPEVEGEDIDGVKFKLSDYRGKVVLLDFWGNW
jgi:tetratricopeptide (TPR) repeat protein